MSSQLASIRQALVDAVSDFSKDSLREREWLMGPEVQSNSFGKAENDFVNSTGLNQVEALAGRTSRVWGSYFQPNGVVDFGEDPAGSYRHLLLAGELARRYGRTPGLLLANAHEVADRLENNTFFPWQGNKNDGGDKGPTVRDEDIRSGAFDYHNNEIGARLGADARSFEDVRDKARQVITAALQRKRLGQSLADEPSFDYTEGVDWDRVRAAQGNPDMGEYAFNNLKAPLKPKYKHPAAVAPLYHGQPRRQR